MLLARGKVLPSAPCYHKQEGQGKEVQAVTVPGQQTGSVAVMFLFHAANIAFRSNISCLFCSSRKHRGACRRQVQGRAGPRQHTADTADAADAADAAGKCHLLLLHILAQAPCPEWWIHGKTLSRS